MPATTTHQWAFKPRFRRHAFGWRSQPAITRIKEAVSEIKKIGRSDAVLAAEGSVIFLERLIPAIEQVDGSSGSMGSAVRNAIDALVPIIAAAPADGSQRCKWLERLWQAIEEEDMGYYDDLPDQWGELCASQHMAAQWADRFLPAVRADWQHQNSISCIAQSAACLSSLLAAARYSEIDELLKLQKVKHWHYEYFGVMALAARGQTDAAVERALTAESACGRMSVDAVCEQILLQANRRTEAYRYALLSTRATTNIATYRAVAKKYPELAAEVILNDLIATTPGAEGKWFATAKELALFSLAIRLSQTNSADPMTLLRAANEFMDSDPAFAFCCAQCSFHWMVEGYGYNLTNGDMLRCHGVLLEAATRVNKLDEIRTWVAERIAMLPHTDYVRRTLG